MNALAPADTDAMTPPVEFDPATGVAELRLDARTFRTPRAVNRYFDEAETMIAQSGRSRWYGLTNVTGFDPESDPRIWLSYCRRMHVLNRAHCIARCLYDRNSTTPRQSISGASGEASPLRQFRDRDAAIAYLLSHEDSCAIARMTATDRAHYARTIRKRLHFDMRAATVEMDLRNLQIDSVPLCDLFCDVVHDTLAATGRRWYFIILYEGMDFSPGVWPTYAARGKDLNRDFSLGTVRVAPDDAVAQEISGRAESQSFDPNLVADTEQARARIAQLADRAATTD